MNKKQEDDINAPTTALPTHLPRISTPSFSASARVVKMHIAAPSPTPLALPAVVDASPQSGNTGFSVARPSEETLARIVSSTETVVPLSSMGRISSENTPLAEA